MCVESSRSLPHPLSEDSDFRFRHVKNYPIHYPSIGSAAGKMPTNKANYTSWCHLKTDDPQQTGHYRVYLALDNSKA